MSAICIFNSGATPQNVLQYIPSNADPAQYAGRQDALIDPDLSPVAGLPLIYWKVVAGALAAMTTQEKASVDAALTAAATAQEQAGALGDLSAIGDQNALVRAIVLITMNEINLLRGWITSFQAAVSASTNLANLQTRVAALGSYPDRTNQQLIAAIQAQINSGAAN